MKFTMKFKAGADAEFVIPEEHLAKHPETMLSVLSKPRWNTDGAAAQVIEPVDVADASWADGTGEAIVAWYGRDGAAFELPLGVELRDFVAIADWLLLDVGDLRKITYEGGNDDDNLARVLRAKTWLSRRANVGKGITFVKEAMIRSPSNKFAFGFLRNDDNESYINKARGTPLIAVGNRFGKDPHFEWAEDEVLRTECARAIEGCGLKTAWSHVYLELSGSRLRHESEEYDYPRAEVGSVYEFRWVLHVAVPEAEPAPKRRCLA